MTNPRDESPIEGIVAQLEYLILEMEALRQAVLLLPDIALSGRPYDGEPSVKDVFAGIAHLDRSVRLTNVRLLLQGDGANLKVAAPVTDTVDETADAVVLIDEVSNARSELLDAVRELPEADWEKTARLDGESVTLTEYLFGVTQEDADVLRLAAQRIYESRPVRSPGFTAS